MDLLESPWTLERFIEWDNRQEQKHEFDGTRVIPMTGSSAAHQRLGFNIMAMLLAAMDPALFVVLQEMRIRIGRSARYPDVVVTPAPVAQTTRTLTDALVLFEVCSEETAHIDQIDRLNEYATLPSIRRYVLIQQNCVGALVHTREDGRWITHAVTEGSIALPEFGAELPIADIYAGLTF